MLIIFCLQEMTGCSLSNSKMHWSYNSPRRTLAHPHTLWVLKLFPRHMDYFSVNITIFVIFSKPTTCMMMLDQSTPIYRPHAISHQVMSPLAMTLSIASLSTHCNISLTCPVNKLSQYMKAPIEIHMQAAKRVLRYLKKQ